MLAESARQLVEQGIYAPSRPPGYPVTELALTPLVAWGPLATNGATALMSVLCVLALRDLLRAAGADGAAELALAFALVPVVWVASVTTIDYLWSLALTLAGLRSAAHQRPAVAGIWIGLAAGARASGALALLPALALMRRRGPCALAFAVVAATAYTPVLVGYGLEGLRPAGGARPNALFVARQASVDVFGELGVVAVGAALALGLSRRSAATPLARAGALLAAPNLLLYLVAPYEPEYLIPAAAGLLLWLGPRLPRPACAALAAALATSSLVGVTRPAPVLVDRERRIAEQELVDRVVRAVQEQVAPTALLCGRMYPKVRFALGGQEQIGPVTLHVALRSEARLRRLLAQGVDLRYVPGIEGWYERRTGHRIDLIARPLP